MLIPLIDGYQRLAHELRASDPPINTTVTELVRAQLHRGPDMSVPPAAHAAL
jgi:hypothetical protein